MMMVSAVMVSEQQVMTGGLKDIIVDPRAGVWVRLPSPPPQEALQDWRQ